MPCANGVADMKPHIVVILAACKAGEFCVIVGSRMSFETLAHLYLLFMTEGQIHANRVTLYQLGILWNADASTFGANLPHGE